MTIGTPLWDEFVSNLLEVKRTVEIEGFMPDDFPSKEEIARKFTPQLRDELEKQFIEYYRRYAYLATQVVHNSMRCKVDKVNEEVRNLYFCNYVNLEEILRKIGDDFLKYIINMSELCDVNIIKSQYLDVLGSIGVTKPENTERYFTYLNMIGLEYIYCINELTDSFDSRVFNDAQKEVLKSMIRHSAKVHFDKFGEELPTVIDMDNKFKEKIENLKKDVKSRSLPKEFASYFTAPFKGIGTGNINFYEKLEESLTDPVKKRTGIDYARIAFLIYNSKCMIDRKRPNTFAEWRKIFSESIGIPDSDYKPSKLKDTESLEKEFYYLF